ncbi:hypothetical protein TL16_g00263 [Triparma laevis f. inornata]|uniref:Glutamine amidotransferase type-2 domain-containing protein n=1 Tax=Triparma laevis f. inornata TaxID=1714386 RepID=A0A9W7DN17_9STRA|nr:hypothetical protein TL16_g00263 [Triparma laevis f. inornata]
MSTSPLLSYSNHLQSRRGPDLTTHSVHHDVHFIHNLLWMNGEFKTSQPFLSAVNNPHANGGATTTNGDNDIVAIYNGEIYNADSITPPNGESDGRSIIPSYLASGSTYARNLDGEFAIALFDFSSNVLLLSADTFGTKPLWYSIQPTTFTISSYASAITRLGYQGTQLEPNTVLKFDLDPTTKNPILGSKQKFELTTFDLKQYKPHTDDFVKAFMESIRKRTQDLKTVPFVGLSSGYDSGAVACALASTLKTDGNPTQNMNAYSIRGGEDMQIVKERLELTAPLINKTFSFSQSEYYHQTFKLKLNCEPYAYPGNLGYSGQGGNEMDMRTDPGAIGLSKICEEARNDNSLIYFSGTGADEIISDYGFGGKKLTPHSSFGGKFPDDLAMVFPWYNFFGGTQRAYLMKEELIAGTYGIEARYPFLDVSVVQEFLWLTAEVKNSEYKRSIGDLLRSMRCSFDPGKKVGFSANPSQHGEGDQEKTRAGLTTAPPIIHSECPKPSIDIDGMLNHRSSQTLKLLQRYITLHPSCAHLHLKLADHTLSNSRQQNYFEHYVRAIDLTSDEAEKYNLASKVSLKLFENYKINDAVKIVILAIGFDGPTPVFIYNTLATAFIGNSPLFLDSNYSSKTTTLEFKELASTLREALVDESVQDAKFKELAGYALSAVMYGFLVDKEGSQEAIKTFVLANENQPVKESSGHFDHFMYHAGGLSPLKIGTVATKVKEEVYFMVESGSRGGVAVDVIGLGMEWEGNPTKVKMYKAYVEKLDPEQIVLLADAYDVLLSPEIGKVVEIFEEKFDNKIIFGGELRCWPDASFEPLYPPSTSRFRFLNSGSYLGRAKHILPMLNDVLGYASLLISDQRAFTRYMHLHPDLVVVDSDAEIFRSLHLHAEVPHANIVFDFDGFVATAGERVNRPLLLHGNGNDGNMYYKHVAGNMFGAGGEYAGGGLYDFSKLPIEKIRDNVRLAAERGGLGGEDLNGIIGIAAEMGKRGRFEEGAKVLYWGYVASRNPVLLVEYARWFAGEACPFCTSSVKDSGLAQKLHVFLDKVGRYSKGGEEWKEITQFNIATVHHWLGEVEESEAMYRSILAKGEVENSRSSREGGAIVNKDPTLHVAAVATQERPELANLVNSAAVHSIHVDVLGMGDSYLGNSQKVQYFLKYALEKVRHCEERSDELRLRYFATGTRTIWCCFWTHTTCWFLRGYFLTHRNSVGIDTSGSLFVTLHGIIDESVITKGPSFKLGSSLNTSIVHGNAGGLGGKKYYEQIADAMKTVAQSQDGKVEVKVDPPFYSSAIISYRNGDLIEAINFFKKHLLKEPSHVDSLYNIGVAYADLEDYDGAREYYEACLRVDLDNASCNLNLGVLLVEKVRDVEGGKKALERAAKLDPARAGVLRGYIEAL